jgi:hypothetical protein
MKSVYEQFRSLSWNAERVAEFNAAFNRIESLLNFASRDEDLLEALKQLLENKTYRNITGGGVSEFDIAQVLLVVANRTQVQE